MPLNIQNKEYVTIEEDTRPEPIVHAPKQGYPGIRYFILGFFIVAVVCSAVFLIYLFSLNLQVGTPPTNQVFTTQVIDSSVLSPSQPIAAETTTAEPHPVDTLPAVKLTPPVEPAPSITPSTEKFIPGLYTVYIGAYRVEPPASEEAGRWNDAGYPADVVPTRKYYRVALGQYKTIEEAKVFAEQMWEAFEYGYWIGKVQ